MVFNPRTIALLSIFVWPFIETSWSQVPTLTCPCSKEIKCDNPYIASKVAPNAEAEQTCQELQNDFDQDSLSAECKKVIKDCSSLLNKKCPKPCNTNKQPNNVNDILNKSCTTSDIEGDKNNKLVTFTANPSCSVKCIKRKKIKLRGTPTPSPTPKPSPTDKQNSMTD